VIAIVKMDKMDKMDNLKSVASFRFLAVAATAMVFLWAAGASAQHARQSDGPSISLSNHFGLSGVFGGQGGSIQIPGGSNSHENPFGGAIQQFLASRLPAHSSNDWLGEAIGNLIDRHRPPTTGGHQPPANAVPEPQAALLFAIGIGTATVVRKRRS
jgi:hypothetical protein